VATLKTLCCRNSLQRDPGVNFISPVVLAGVKSKIFDGVTTRIASTTVASDVMARHLPSGTLTFLLTACLVAARLRDWKLTLTLTARTMYVGLCDPTAGRSLLRAPCWSHHRSGATGCLLNKVHARGDAEFGVDVGKMGLHGAG
jgi:hypothetical protein